MRSKMNLSDYCVVCGLPLEGTVMRVGFRGRSGCTAAFACNGCSRSGRIDSTEIKGRLRHVGVWPFTHYYIGAKPYDIPEDEWMKEWQDEDRVYIEIERVYATRYDCQLMPERVRQAM